MQKRRRGRGEGGGRSSGKKEWTEDMTTASNRQDGMISKVIFDMVYCVCEISLTPTIASPHETAGLKRPPEIRKKTQALREEEVTSRLAVKSR